MSHETLALHSQELALLKQARERDREQDAERDKAVLKAIQDLSDKVDALNKYVQEEVKQLNEKHTTLDKAVGEAKAALRGFGSGWAAAFTLLGASVGVAIANFTGLFK